MIYIATFYSHFGAMRFKKVCEEAGFQAKLMPVPRELSSSCGTCVRYESDCFDLGKEIPDEVEQIVEINKGEYIPHFNSENS